MERGYKLLVAGLVCGVVASVVYTNTLECGIVFDDEPAIKKNKDLRPHTSWFNLLVHDFWGAEMSSKTSHKSYRPLCVATFRLNYLLHELQPMGYHLVNVLLHSAVCYLYVQLCGVVFSEVWPALIAGLLFAVHPIHTEAVAGLVGRTELLSGLFFLAALLSYHKTIYKRSQSLLWMGATIVFGLCSVLSKEQGITVVAVCVFYDFCVAHKMNFASSLELLKGLIKDPRSVPGWFVQFMKRTAVLAMFAVGFLVFRIRLMEGSPDIFSPSVNPPLYLETPYRQLSWLYLIFVNAQLLVNPSHLCPDWRFGVVPLITSVTNWHNVMTVAVFAILAVLGTFSVYSNSKQAKILLFGLILLAFPFIPASNLFFPVGFVVAERILYTPSMGLCFIVGYGAWFLHKRAGNLFSRSSLKLLILALLVFYAAKSFHRNNDWKTNVTLYGSGVKCNPNNGVMLTNLGIEHGRLKNFTFAEHLYRRSIMVAPQHSRGFSNLGGLLEALKRYDESEEMFRKSIELGKRDSTGAKVIETVVFLIEKVMMRDESRYSDSLTLCNEVLQDYPAYAQLYSLKGYILFKLGRPQEALEPLDMATQSQLMLPQTHYYLGMAYASLGKIERARVAFETAMQLDPNYEDTPYQLARILYLSGVQGKKLVDVQNMLLMALNKKPRHTDAAYVLGQVYLDLKDYPKAEEVLRKVRKARPADLDAQFHLARALQKQHKLEEALSLLQHVVKRSTAAGHSDAKKLLQSIEQLL